MNELFKDVHINMKQLGLGALAHANRHAIYRDDYANDKWGELSVLQAAHAAEILIKAKIAEEHPLLLITQYPQISNDDLSINDLLLKDTHSIEWHELNHYLWATCGMKIPNFTVFKDFGKLRNGIQHLGMRPSDISPSLATLKFIYSVIDPFINDCWRLYAIDYDEEYDPYIYMLPTLIYYEIPFLVSSEAVKCHCDWDNNLNDCSIEYQHIMGKRIQNALNGGENDEERNN